jgi:acyl-CoA oxidase
MDNVDRADLRRVVDGRWADVRERVRRTVPAEWCEPAGDLRRDEHRARTTARARELAATGLPGLGFEKAYGGDDDIGGSLTFFEMLGLVDLSVMVKAGVQWGLFGAAIQALGTERHHERYLPAMMTLELPGCFAMTETGHGSDVQSLRTTATYEPGTEEFVVTTPDDDARKDYIGNAARDGRVAVVFAQLVTQGESHGVHAVLVPIRDEHGNPCAGVRIEDCGHKGGLNGVDNGRLWFDDVRVSRDNLLDQYGAVAPDGTYSSPIENRSQRFFTMLGALVRGRISVGGAAAGAATVALATALRYGEVRTQFARPGGGEVVVLDYLAHQRRLLPALATSYALHFAQGQLVSDAHDIQTGGTTDEAAQRELESRAAGLKVLSTWHATATIQTCREACGGAGYLSASRLVALKADTDVFATFEGDNTVLLQLVARAVLTRYRDHFGDLDAMSTLRFLAEQVKETVLEKTSARGLADRLAAATPGRGAGDCGARPAPTWTTRTRPSRHSTGFSRTRSPPAGRTCTASCLTRSRPLWATAATRGPAPCSTAPATSTPSPRSRPTGRGSSSTAVSPPPAPRRSAPPSTTSAASCGSTSGCWSTGSGFPRSGCRPTWAEENPLDGR